jgi:hypothetical protein
VDEDIEAALMRAGAQINALQANERRLIDELAALRKDAERYRWLRAKNSHHLHNSAWLASLTAVKDGPCDIFSADEVPALLDAEIDRRMARAVGAA